LALALLSRAFLQQGKTGEAQSALSRANTLSAKSSDVATTLVSEVDNAYALAAARNFRGAEHLAKGAFTEAKKLTFVQTQMEPSLALGEIQMKGQNPAEGRVVRPGRIEPQSLYMFFGLKVFATTTISPANSFFVHLILPRLHLVRELHNPDYPNGLRDRLGGPIPNPSVLEHLWARPDFAR
jgi:hypothetical protein